MKVVHLMAGGPAAGGIETLMRDYAKASKNENIFIFAWGEGPSVDWIREVGCEVVVLNGKSTGNRKMISDAIKAIDKAKPDYVIIQHATPELRLIGILIAKRFPTYVYHHSNAANEYSSTGLKRLITHWIYMVSTRLAKKNIAISESVKKSVHEYFKIPNDKIEVIYNGVDLKKFHPKEKEKNEIVKLIFVGRLVEGKGVQIILKALSQLQPEIRYRFSVVGDGPYRTKLEKLTSEYSLDDKVSFLGQRQDIPELLRDHDVFITVPTFEEGLGNSLIEAMASGKTCICSKSGGLSEIIDDSIDGYIVEKNDIEGLKSILHELIITYPSQLSDEIEAAAVRRAKAFNIEAYGTSMDKIGGGIAKSEFKIIPISNFNRPIELIYVGRLEKVKGVQNILKGLEKADKKFHLSIVGDGEYTNELKRLSHKLLLDDNVDFLGRRDDIPELLSKADVFVHLPEWEEGFGIAVVEAMASGLICICGNVGALPEIIEDGVNGYLVEKSNYSLFWEKVNDYLQNSNGSASDMYLNALCKAFCFSIEKYAYYLDQIEVGFSK